MYKPKFWNIAEVIKNKVKRVSFLNVCYSNGERVCEKSVIIPEMSTKEDRKTAINFIRKWDKNFKSIIWAQIHHYEKGGAKNGGDCIKYGIWFFNYNNRAVPLKLL